MGIRVFLKKDQDRETVLRTEDRGGGVVKSGLALVDSIGNFFSPDKVVEWRYLVGKEIGGELGETQSYEIFKSSVTEGKAVHYYSVFRINGEWTIGNVRWSGFISINVSPLLSDQGDIYMDINPAFFEDINDIIYSQENKKEIIKELVDGIKSLKIKEGAITLSIRKILSEDEEYPIFMYSKDKAIAWKSAEEYLAKENKVDEVKPFYNWDKMYDLFLQRESAKKVIMNAEDKFGVTEEAGSVLLIGTSRDSLDKAFKELSVKLRSFMDKLERKGNIEQKIDETFGHQTQSSLEQDEER